MRASLKNQIDLVYGVGIQWQSELKQLIWSHDDVQGEGRVDSGKSLI